MLGFGQDGPYKDRAGYDVIAASIGGLMHITGPEVSSCHHKPSNDWAQQNFLSDHGD